jgi:Ran-binding protein 3
VFTVETGEERETTIFSCRAKLFSFDKGEKAWKERGVGIFKLNATVNEMDNEYDQWSRSSGGSEGEEADIPTIEKNAEDTRNAENVQETQNTEKRKARLLMRADGVLRVVLNVPVFKGMKVGDEKGNPPTGRMVSLIVVEDGNAVPLLIKVLLRIRRGVAAFLFIR